MNGLKWLALMLLCWSAVQAAQASEDVNQKARAALDAGRVAEATQLLHQQVMDNPRDYQAWFLLGVSQAKIQRYHPAIESFHRVSELRPDLAEPHNNLAVIYNELGDVPAAIQELEASLKKHPGYLIAEENIADLYVKMALSYYKKALEKTDDKALQMRYARLLQVRDPAGVSSTSMPVMASHAEVPKAVTSNNVKKSVRTQKAIPTVDSTVTAVNDATPSTSNSTSSMMADLKAVKAAVEAWRSAWANQNLPDYFAAYADDYIVPERFKDQAAWEAYKARVIGNKKFITVTLTDMEVALTDDRNHAQVTFQQAFRSNSYNGDDKKRLTLKKVNGAWKIIVEETL